MRLLSSKMERSPHRPHKPQDEGQCDTSVIAGRKHDVRLAVIFTESSRI